MSSDPELAIPYLDPNQTGKTVTLNQALTSLAEAVSASLSISAASNASPYTIPFNTTGDEPEYTKEALRFAVLTITGAITSDWTAYFPGGGYQKTFIATNSTTGGHNVILKVSGQTGITIASGATVLAYLNGTDVQLIATLSGGGGTPYDVSITAPGVLANSQVLLELPFVRTVTFPASLTGSEGTCGVNATASAAIAVKKNGSQIGTITYSSGSSTPTFTMSSSASFSAGDILTLTGPSTADATLANVGICLTGTR